jgi:drug/metabolite transporter (DMT)-like permease
MIAFAGGLLGHCIFGIQPPFARYLQRVSNLPTFLLLVVSNIIALAVYSPRFIWLIIQRIRTAKNNNETTTSYKQIFNDVSIRRICKRYSLLAIYVVSIVVRTVTLFYAAKWTSSLYVQLFSLSTPFMITILTIFVMNRFLPEEQKERWNWKCFVVTIVTVFGGVLIVIGNAVPPSENTKWYSFLTTVKIDWNSIAQNLTMNDILGIGMTLFSSLCIVIYLLVIRFMKLNPDPDALKVSDETLYLLQEVSIVVSFIIPSLIMEDWTVLISLNWKDYLILALHGVLVDFGGNLLNIYSVRALGPTVTASMLPLRLITAIIVGYIILSESFKSIWQPLGAILVCVAVSFFMLIQYIDKKRSSQNSPIELKDIDNDEPIIDDSTDIPSELPLDEESTDRPEEISAV